MRLLFIIILFSFNQLFGQIIVKERMLPRIHYLTGSTENTFPINQDTFSVDTGIWHYAAWVKNNSIGKIFIDGLLVDSGKFSGVDYYWNEIDIGCHEYLGYHDFFNGEIDELRISKISRSNKEIKNYFDSFKEFVSDANTVGLWHFNEGTGSSFSGTVGSSGTLYNTSWSTGMFGSCLKLNGTNSRGNILQNSIPENNLTVEFWFKQASWDSGDPMSFDGGYTTHFNLRPVKDTFFCDSTLYKGSNSYFTKCNGDTIQLFGKPGYFSYSWNNGSTGAENVVKNSGQYLLTMTDSNGCVAIDTFQVSMSSTEIFPIDTTICSESPVGLNSKWSTTSTTCSKPSKSLSDSLIGWWPFCGNANDYSGNNNHGLISNNSIHITTDRNGNPSSAYQFNNNGFIDLGNLNLPESFSVSLWYKVADSFEIDVTDCEWRESIFSNLNHYNGAASGFEIGISRGRNANQQEQEEIQLKNEFTDNTIYWSGLNNSTAVNKWHHMVLTYDSVNDTLTLWHNGIKSKQIATTYVPKLNSSFYLGSRPWCSGSGGSGFHYQGKIDDVGVWSRALLNSEIQELFNYNDPKSYTVTWSTGDTSSQITVSPVVDTQYWVSVSDGTTTCYDTCMVRVSNPKSNVLADSISCFGLQDGSANLSTSGGIAPYAIQWSTGDTTSLLSNLIAGTYAAVVTDSIGCTDSVSIELTEPPLLQLSVVNIDSVNCFNGFDGSASVRAEGGNTGAYSFQWNDPDIQTDSLAIGLAFGQYKVRVLDTKGCSDSLIIDVGQPPLLQLSLLNSQDPSCYNYADGFISTSATGGTPGYTFIWNLSPDPGTDSVASLPSGDYWVYVQDKNGCLDSLNKELINPDQIVVKIQDPIRSIKGLPITLNADVSPSNNYQYTWSPSATFQDQASEQNPTITLDADQGVRLVVVDSNGCIGQDSTTARVLQGTGIIFPNSFSPNDDGRNDVFKPHQYFDLLDLKIYNAWGQCIYQSNGSKNGWDGTFAGEKVPAGAYVYQMKVQLIGTSQITSQSGSVTLVR